jgi:hypothetical protein
MVERGSEEAKDAGSRKYTDRSAELETATAARRDPQQGATRRYIAEAHKPFAL